MGDFSAGNDAVGTQLLTHGGHGGDVGYGNTFFLNRPGNRRPAASAGTSGSDEQDGINAIGFHIEYYFRTQAVHY